MTKESEKEERAYFDEVKSALTVCLREQDGSISSYSGLMSETQAYLNDAFAEMDKAEKASVATDILQTDRVMNHTMLRRSQVLRLLDSPYFGRIDFTQKGKRKKSKIYIGIHNFETDAGMLIHDWRAPVASMFYDYEVGDAQYVSPAGLVQGKIGLKRQYRIRSGVLEYMFDSSVKIDDDILQEALSHPSSRRMKNIISTIQREQNKIIRDEESEYMLIQGVAGSGKTSIALHRIAYLLYRFKEELSSRNILIISPNKVFADYISNVLPELGEENIAAMEMENFIRAILGSDFKFQTFYEQVEELAHTQDAELQAGIRLKASLQFAKRLEEFARYLELNNFQPTTMWLPGVCESPERLRIIYSCTQEKPLKDRINEIADVIFRDTGSCKQGLRADIRRRITQMFQVTDAFSAYRLFFEKIKREQYAPERKEKMDYADVFPYLYLLPYFEKVSFFNPVKYLLIDEMQDYTPVQYMVLKKLFDCKMTILGDSLQAVNPYSSTRLEDIQEIFTSAATLELNKSYRSSYEIMQLAQKIIYSAKLSPMERHGEPPAIVKYENRDAMMKAVCEGVAEFRQSGYKSLGIICKTQEHAGAVYQAIAQVCPEANLLDSASKGFPGGVMVVSSHLAKGLEFDSVIIPDVSATEYFTDVDRHVLYVACTMAMHRLFLFYCGECCEFIR